MFVGVVRLIVKILMPMEARSSFTTIKCSVCSRCLSSSKIFASNSFLPIIFHLSLKYFPDPAMRKSGLV